MLPAFLTSPRKLATFGAAAAVMTALAAPPAMADWGPRQQGVVTGIAASLLVATIINPHWYNRTPAQAVHYPATLPAQTPVYYSPAPTYTASI